MLFCYPPTQQPTLSVCRKSWYVSWEIMTICHGITWDPQPSDIQSVHDGRSTLPCHLCLSYSHISGSNRLFCNITKWVLLNNVILGTIKSSIYLWVIMYDVCKPIYLIVFGLWSHSRLSLCCVVYWYRCCCHQAWIITHMEEIQHPGTLLVTFDIRCVTWCCAVLICGAQK